MPYLKKLIAKYLNRAPQALENAMPNALQLSELRDELNLPSSDKNYFRIGKLLTDLQEFPLARACLLKAIALHYEARQADRKFLQAINDELSRILMLYPSNAIFIRESRFEKRWEMLAIPRQEQIGLLIASNILFILMANLANYSILNLALDANINACIIKYLDLQDLMNLRKLNKLLLYSITTAFQSMYPYQDDITFNFSSHGCYKNRDDYLNALNTYFFSMRFYQSSLPVVLYKLRDREMHQTQIYQQFCAGEDVLKNGRRYNPPSSRDHTLDSNRSWVLSSIIHLKRDAFIYSLVNEHNVRRINNQTQASAFAHEIAILSLAGYHVKVRKAAPYIVTMCAPSVQSAVSISNTVLENEDVLKICKNVEMKINLLKNILSSFDSITSTFLNRLGIRHEISFKNLHSYEIEVAALNLDVCNTFKMRCIMQEISETNFSAKFNHLQLLANEADLATDCSFLAFEVRNWLTNFTWNFSQPISETEVEQRELSEITNYQRTYQNAYKLLLFLSPQPTNGGTTVKFQSLLSP